MAPNTNIKKKYHSKYKNLIDFIKVLLFPKYVKRTCVGDGNCLFRALSDQLYSNEMHCNYIRLMTVELMRVMEDDFINFIDERDTPNCDYNKYLEKIAKNGEWSDDREIRALSILYGMPIEIYDKAFHKQKTFHDEQFSSHSQKIIRVLWEHNPGHFSSVEKLGQIFPLTLYHEPGELEKKGLTHVMKQKGIPNPDKKVSEIHDNIQKLINTEEYTLPFYSNRYNLPRTIHHAEQDKSPFPQSTTYLNGNTSPQRLNLVSLAD